MAAVVSMLHVLVVGHASLAVGPVLEVRLHDGAHEEEGGRRVVWDAGIGINAFLSVYINSVGNKKRICNIQYVTNQNLSRQVLTLTGWRRSSPRSGSRACMVALLWNRSSRFSFTIMGKIAYSRMLALEYERTFKTKS